MAKAKVDTTSEETKGNDKVVSDLNGVKITQHLDKDANDPRNTPKAEQLPSLDDPSQNE